MYFEKAKEFIYKNARPIDFARWKFLFEDGSANDVVTALSVYQNKDGGFGNALEPDCWNPNSSPIQTWVATEIIKEIKLENREHPIIQGILKYLSSGKDFDGHIWFNSIPSNDQYPHAPWWDYDPNQVLAYNPTASLLGFVLKYAKKDSEFYKLACTLTKEAYQYFKEQFPMDSMHTVFCFVELYEYMKDSKITTIIDLDEFNALLHKQIQHVITYDTERWNIEYVCKPSLYINDKNSDFYLENQNICMYEHQFILDTQQEDGAWNITFAWDAYPEQWNISKNWWKSDFLIRNIKFLQNIK